MKKNIIGLISALSIIALTACGNKPDASEPPMQNAQTEQEAAEIKLENEEAAEDISEQQEETNLPAGETETDSVLETLVGEYEYVSDYGKGSLIIKKEEQGYSIDDYETETSYRFLAYSSDIEYLKNNRIYIKYPDKVYSDDSVVFCEYILEYGTDEITVYCKKKPNDDEQFLYCATEKKENQEVKEKLEMTPEELFDSFINGSIDAVDSTDLTSTFNITDLKMDSEEWDSYSVGERIDLDNDGEIEQIICGPYGGMYLDAHDNKIYKFAEGDGTSIRLSYTYYNGEIWIMYSNNMNAGYEYYHMEKYEGADNLVAEMSFGEEILDTNNPESEMKYLLNGNEVSYDEYTAFCSKIFAAEESAN